MSLLPRLCRLVVLACLMAGCQSTTGKLPDGVTPNAVAGDAIEVTALDAPTAAPAPVSGAAVPDAPTQGATPPTGPEDAVAVPAPIPAEAAEGATTEAAPEATEAAAAAEAPAEAAPVVVPKSDGQKACERKKGIWASTDGGLKVCVRKTGDSGKRCDSESDCEGVCLARSGTCAPADPLLGCNEVLQDDGQQATLCIE
jgi:hypothetical protein